MRTTPSKNVFLFFFVISHLLRKFYPVCLSVLKLATAEYATNAFSWKIQIRKICCCDSRSPPMTEFCHFRLLFGGGRQRNVPKIVTHVHSYCFGLQTYCLVTFFLLSCFAVRSLVNTIGKLLKALNKKKLS